MQPRALPLNVICICKLIVTLFLSHAAVRNEELDKTKTMGYIVEPGPQVIATNGEIWPAPSHQTTYDTFWAVNPDSFQFVVVNHTCDILTEAIDRYQQIISNAFHRKRTLLNPFTTPVPTSRSSHLFGGDLIQLTINVEMPCERFPYLEMDEAYDLRVLPTGKAKLGTNSIWGALRGLESFSQMLVMTDDLMSLRINSTLIFDAPRFAHRGLLLDTSRHFVPMPIIRSILDGMSYTKLNVFHWHIVDDQSFPYVSIRYPELSKRGAYHPNLMVYTQHDVAEVIEYARLRGIRVLAEFDTPGHTRSWGVSHPEILTQCGHPYDGKLGPIDPTKEESYELVGNLLREISQVFPDRYVHLGGDEVGFECWQSNARIGQYMKANNITTYAGLEERYIQRVVDMAQAVNVSSIVWQEVFTNGVRLPDETVVHVWLGNQSSLLAQITNNGFKAILSTCWYLDHLKTGGDWTDFYRCDPHQFPGTSTQKKLVIGGEACMWSEVVDSTNVVSRIFPRACAAAEKLWSPKIASVDMEHAKRRMEEHTCRMHSRGIAAQPPNGPGFCI